MTQPTIGLDQLDALASLLPDNTPPRAVIDIARWGITLRAALQPFVEASIEAGATVAAILEEAGLSPACIEAPQASGQPGGAGVWTDQEKQTLELMWRAGAPASDIAAALPNRNPRSIGEMRRRIGLPARAPEKSARAAPTAAPWTQEEEAILLRMCARGATSKAIAAALPGRTVRAVQLRRSVLRRLSGVPTKKEDVAAAAATPEGATAPVAASVEVAVPPAVKAAVNAWFAEAQPSARSPMSPGAERILAAMAELNDDGFTRGEDRLLVEERFKGAAIGGIAEHLGRDEDEVSRRWKQIRGCKVGNEGGLITEKGWADLRAAVAYRAEQAEA